MLTHDILVLTSRAAMSDSSSDTYKRSLRLLIDVPGIVPPDASGPFYSDWNWSIFRRDQNLSLQSEVAARYFDGDRDFTWRELFPRWKALGLGTPKFGRRDFPSRFVFGYEAIGIGSLAEAASLLLGVAPLVPDVPELSHWRSGNQPVSSTRYYAEALWLRRGIWTVAEHERVSEGFKRIDEALTKRTNA